MRTHCTGTPVHCEHSQGTCVRKGPATNSAVVLQVLNTIFALSTARPPRGSPAPEAIAAVFTAVTRSASSSGVCGRGRLDAGGAARVVAAPFQL